MEKAGIDAVIIPTSDPHTSEYVHEHWKTREWFSGFNGSAGTLVITKKEAGLWTDFRYYIQADTELQGTDIKLYKDGLPDTPSITDFIKRSIPDGGVTGIDGSVFPTALYKKFKGELDDNNITIKRDFDPLEDLWSDRPPRPMSKAYSFDVKYAGESRTEKLKRVREIMSDKEIDTYLISSLADIAWLLNIRGSDVTYTPLIVSYVLVSKDQTELFIDSDKIEESLIDELKKDGITVKEYVDIADRLQLLKTDSSIYFMPEYLNSFLYGVIPESVEKMEGLDITAELKTIKNSVEIENIRIAMEKDGAALVKFFKRFEERRKTESFTEYTLAPLLRECRLEMEDCIDESFGPIIGYESNGALCHYSAEEDSAKEIGKDGLLLIDSGGQYLQGTTDITRTITLGAATVEEIEHYTLVLKGHVKLSMAIYPEGTTGAQLDILAREPLWNRGLNFGHGTGHGVGFFLGVHEGPQNISSRGYKTPLKPGMVTSNEPGIYIEGRHGIRIENLVLTKFREKGLYQDFYDFETLTLYPYDHNLIDPDLLTEDERVWINSYHREVLERLSPYLNREEVLWLEERTREI